MESGGRWTCDVVDTDTGSGHGDALVAAQSRWLTVAIFDGWTWC